MYSTTKKLLTALLIMSMVLSPGIPAVYAQAYGSAPSNPISGGSGWHNLVLQNDGTVWAWGDNFKGQLGMGKAENSPVPVQVKDMADTSGYLTNVVAVARNEYSSIALKKDGTVWEWGARGAGNHTDNAFNMYNPSQVKAQGDPSGYLSDIIAIAESTSHAIALRKDGTIWTWGNGSHGALGYRESTVLEARIVPNVQNVVAIAAGADMTVILKNDSSVWFCGDIRTETDFYTSVEDVRPLKDGPGSSKQLMDVEKIYGGRHNMAFIKKDGSVWTLNKDTGKDLVCTRIKDSGDPQGYLFNARELAFTGIEYMEQLIVLKNDGKVYTMTCSEDGTFNGYPVQTNGIENAAHIAAGSLHCVALKQDGSLVSWGRNSNYQLGNGSNLDSATPVQVNNLKIGTGSTPTINSPVPTAPPAPPVQQPQTVAGTASTAKGNTSGNLQNGGYAAQQGDYIYYANPLDGYRLYKIKSDDTGNMKLSNCLADNINALDKWVYFRNMSDSKLYRTGTDGKSEAVLVSEPVDSVTVSADAIYFIAEDNDRNDCIYKTDLGGKGKTLLVNTMSNAYNLCVAGNYLFYRTSGYNASVGHSIVRLYRTKLNGTEQREVGQQVTYMDVTGNWVFTAAINDKTYRMNADDETAVLILESGNAKHLNISGDWIYYINGDDNNTLYRIRTNGKDRTRLSNPLPAEVTYIDIAGDWIYTNLGKLKINNK